MQLEDAEELFLLRSDEGMVEFLDRTTFKEVEEAENHIKYINNGIDEDKWIMWAITVEDRLIGDICLWNISEDEKKAELGFALSPSYQGKGMMQEALISVVQYGFEQMKLASIEAVTASTNIKSINLLTRNNFFEGKVVEVTEEKNLEMIAYECKKYRK